MNNDINRTEESCAQMEKQNEVLKILIDHRLLIDLHGMNLHEAMSIAGSWAQRVINSENLMCIGLIHGLGVHSGDYHDFDDPDDLYYYVTKRELGPVLKPRIRALMDRRACNTDCFSIYGENMFCGDSSAIMGKQTENPDKEEFSATINDVNDNLLDSIKIVGWIDLSKFETLRVDDSKSSERVPKNSGITYFMNKAYYEYFKAAQIEWTDEKINEFQII